MDQLPVSIETANQLRDDYGYQINSTFGCDESNAKAFFVYPRASLLIGTTRDVFKAYLELDDVLALALLDIDAWIAYLSKFDN